MTLYKATYRIESTRLSTWDYSSRAWYFVTICTYQKRWEFGQVVGEKMKLSKTGQIADSELRSLASHYDNVALEAFVIMPNHIHAIVAIDGDHCYTPNVEPAAPLPASACSLRSPKAGSLSAIIRSYKSGVSRRCHLDGLQFAWQPGFYEKILRSDASIAAVKNYIESNPRNWEQDRDR